MESSAVDKRTPCRVNGLWEALGYRHFPLSFYIKMFPFFLYLIHCMQLNILPIKYRFDYHDLKLFHSVVNGFSCISLPEYLQPFTNSRLRSSHLDSKCFVSSVMPRNLLSTHNYESTSKRNFSNSFFYRVHLLWNRLPLSLREIYSTKSFETVLLKYLWDDCIAHEYAELVNNFDNDSND